MGKIFHAFLQKYFRTGVFVGAVFAVGAVGDSFFSSGILENSVEPPAILETAGPRSTSTVPAHIPLPDTVKGVYMSSWVAGTRSLRENIISLATETEINAVMIDVKDYTGKVSFVMDDPAVVRVGSGERRIRDIDELIRELHSKGIYVIGRIAVFQDPYFASLRPEVAVRRFDGTLWTDGKGAMWVDPASQSFWEYIMAIARGSYERGFDEINFDYVRYPSDGDMSDMVLPLSGTKYKPGIITSFWSYLGGEMKKNSIPSSVDVFGMTTAMRNDLNIGQILEDALPNFDVISPMIYPSHYPDGFLGFSNPAAHPYEVVKGAMQPAIERATALGKSAANLRPWLQDFDLGAEYGTERVRAQIQALQDIGIQSWMLWDPSNIYTKTALDQE